MKIKHIKIKNFRCYYGEKNLNISTDGKITFIYGLAGAGKTSFVDFISWMFYNKRDFSTKDKIDTHEIYNERVHLETSYGNTFEVHGMIEFEHNDVDYQIIKTITFEKGLMGIDELNSEKELILNYYSDGSWVEYTGNIESKINEIIPKSLSKYFFFHGERPEELEIDVKGSGSIKEAVYKLFGLTEYESAIRHLGSNKSPQTLIHQYHSEMTRKIAKLSTSNPALLLSKIANFEANRKEHESRYNYAKRKREEIEKEKELKLKEIGKVQASSYFEETIKTNEKLIKELENKIKELKKNIGNCFYKSFPYLSLSELTRKSVMLISKEAKEINNNHVVFNNINKPLLKEILSKNQCVCGKTLDNEMIKYIQTTIDTMPPKSYIFILKQFGAKGSEYIETSYEEFLNYETFVQQISNYKDEILELNKKNEDLKEDLKQSSNTKKLYEELNVLDKELKKYLAIESENATKIKEYERAIAKVDGEYQKAVHASSIKTEYEFKIKLLEEIKQKLEKLLKTKNDETLEVLEQNILEIYKQISTRDEDFSNKRFLKDDFTFRNESLTGGQEMVDVYSYIIGMIKALHVVYHDSNKKDFPLIIDAPFSHCDDIQATNIFEVLPMIVPQVIMLTFDKQKVNDSLTSEKVGYSYMLKANKTQTETNIVPVSIDDIRDYGSKGDDNNAN